MNRILLLFITSLLSSLTFAQKATLKGLVSSEGQPVPFANILVSENKQGTNSDANGNFSIALDPGTYTIKVSSVGFETLSEKVTLQAGETLEKNFTIKSGTTLNIFVKTEGKYDKKVEELSVTMDIIKPNIIENKNATNVSEALQQTPGLVIVDNEPQMRGGSGYSFGAGSRVMVLVDDLPLLSGDAGRPSWGFIPVENIEQIEVVKGASSVLYGSGALNGVINVRSAYPTAKPKTKLTFFGGVFDVPKKHRWYDARTMPFNAGMSFLHARQLGKKKNIDLVVGGNLFSENGYIGYTKDTSGMVDPKSNEFDRRARFNFNFRHRIDKVPGLAWGINGNMLFGSSSSAFIWQGFGGDSTFRAAKGVTTRTNQTIFHLDPFVTYQEKNGSTHSLRTRYFNINNDNDNNQGNQSQYFYGEYQYRLVVPKIKDFFITPGIMANYTIGKAELFAGNPPPFPVGYDSIYTNSIGTYSLNSAIFVQIEKKFIDRITVSGGFRLEYFQIGKNDSYTFVDTLGINSMVYDTAFTTKNLQPVFRLGINARVAKATFVRASFGQGFRFPTIAERFVKTVVGPAQVYPNPDLLPERSWSAELGVKQGFKIGRFMGFADVAGFFQRYNNTIEFVAAQWGNPLVDPTFGFGFKSLNIGNSTVWGIESTIMGTGEITKDLKVDVLLGYTYSNPRVDDPNYVYGMVGANNLTNAGTSDTMNAGPREMKYRYNHLVRADIEFTYKGFSIGGSLRYNSFMRNVDNVFLLFGDLGFIKDVGKARNYHKNGDYVIDLRTAYKFASGHKISFIVNNVLNRVYSLRPVSVEAPRSFMIQYQANF